MNKQEQPQKNRYPGIKPFSTEERDLFFGRDRDIAEFYRLMLVQQLTVLYSKSGFGKSSMLNAGVIPLLKQQNVSYFTVRFGNYSNAEQASPPIDSLKRILSGESDRHPVPTDVLDALIPDERSLWYYVKSRQFVSRNPLFILIFDQFEELFTYPAEQIQQFKEQLAELLYTPIPLAFRQREEQIINVDHPDREAIVNTFYERPDVKVVFSVRSDRLALLNGLKDKHPTILRHCYELDALDEAAARQAIIEPARLSGPFRSEPYRYEPEAIDCILSEIRNKQDGKIETTTLQIVCRYVDDNLVGEGHDDLIEKRELGNISSIFQTYYESIIGALPETEKAQAQRLIEKLLIQNGRRIPFEEMYLINTHGIAKELLDKLTGTALMRKELDSQQRMMYEVGHDTLIAPIERIAVERRRREEAEENQRKLEQEREEKLKANREAEEYRQLKEKAEVNARIARRRSRFAFGLAVLALVLLATSLVFFLDAKKNEEAALKGQEVIRETLLRLNDQKLKADSTLLLANRREARSLMLRGDNFHGLGEYRMANQYYRAAVDVSGNDPSLKDSLQTKIREVASRLR